MKKQIKTITLKGKDIIEFNYKTEEELADFKNIRKEYNKLIKFFSLQSPKIKIKFVYSRKEMDYYWGSKNSTVSATVRDEDPYTIYIFSPLVLEKLTKSKRENILSLIIHEIGHAFVTKINKRCFSWMNEGICEFVAGEKYDTRVKRLNWQWFKRNKAFSDTKLSWGKTMNREGYKISFNLVQYIIKKYKKNSIFDLLKIKRTPSKSLENKIEKILHMNINDFLDDFEKTLELI